MKKYYAIISDKNNYYKIVTDHRIFDNYLRKNKDSFGKSFKKRKRAEDFINKHFKNLKRSKENDRSQKEIENDIHKLKIKDNEIIAYTDASFDNKNFEYSIANVFLSNKYGYKELSRKFLNKTYKVENSNTAEKIAILYAIKKAINLNFKKIRIYTDYQNALDEINKENIFSKALNDLKEKIEIQIHHVKGHENNFYNNGCDRLCKKTVNKQIEEITPLDNYVCIPKDVYKDLIDLLNQNLKENKNIAIKNSINKEEIIKSINKIEKINKIKALMNYTKK